METERLMLTPLSPEEIRTLWKSAALYEQQFGRRWAAGLREFLVSDEISPDYAAKLHKAREADPWEFGFAIVHRKDDLVIGMAGYKGPPDDIGMVEIAYGIAPGYQGRGYATEAARALVQYAVGHARITTIRAHTLPETNASTRVLQKCGFTFLGDAMDPQDGRVWRWERKGDIETAPP